MAVKQFPAAWYGFAVSQSKPVVRDVEYWIVAPAIDGWRVELAGTKLNGDWDTTARTLLNLPATAELLSVRDRTAGHFRCAGFDGERLLGALFIAQQPVEVSRSWASAQLGHRFDSVQERLATLSGRPAPGTSDKGAIVCACFDVGCNQIIGAIARGCSTVAAVGTATSAGTNCGSCRTQIARMLDAKPTAKTG
ncbi:MAG: bacterioferritin-associated ferredoxin [Hyphomicrobiaceae bacterium]